MQHRNINPFRCHRHTLALQRHRVVTEHEQHVCVTTRQHLHPVHNETLRDFFQQVVNVIWVSLIPVAHHPQEPVTELVGRVHTGLEQFAVVLQHLRTVIRLQIREHGVYRILTGTAISQNTCGGTHHRIRVHEMKVLSETSEPCGTVLLQGYGNPLVRVLQPFNTQRLKPLISQTEREFFLQLFCQLGVLKLPVPDFLHNPRQTRFRHLTIRSNQAWQQTVPQHVTVRSPAGNKRDVLERVVDYG